MTLFSNENVAIVCPTKDQPLKVIRFLNSICGLTDKPHQIIIADAGHNLKPIITDFHNHLNVLCLYCPVVGQVLQRNFAHLHLSKKIQIVCHLDDDITLAPSAITEMLRYWNAEYKNHPLPLGGVSFNITDLGINKSLMVRKVLFNRSMRAGQVSKSGYASPFLPAKKDCQTSWLLGGATAWSIDVIKQHPHPINFSTRWAVCEDLIYSFPLRHSYRLMVASNARVLHNETYNSMSFRKGIFYGRSGAEFRYHFVKTNSELSTWAYFCITVSIITKNFAIGLFGSPKHLGLFFGGLIGLVNCIRCSFEAGDSENMVKELFKHHE